MYSEMWMTSCVFLILGLACAVAGAVLKYYTQQGGIYKGRAEARVVDILIEPRTGMASLSEFRNRQAAVFEFYAEGHLIKVEDPADTYPCPYHLGQKIPVYYDIDEPEKFHIARKTKWEYLAGTAGILGVVLILAGCALFLFYASGIEV